MAQTDVRIVNERLQTFLLQRAVDERQAGRNRIVKEHATDSRIDHAADVVLNSRTQNVLRIVFLNEVDQVALNAQLDRCLSRNFAGVEREQHFFERSEYTPFTLCTRTITRQVV